MRFTVRTKSLKKILHFVKLEILRIVYYRYMSVFQTISLMTFFAIEMAVQFLHGTIMVVMTITILGRATSVFHHVNHVVFGEKNQCLNLLDLSTLSKSASKSLSENVS